MSSCAVEIGFDYDAEVERLLDNEEPIEPAHALCKFAGVDRVTGWRWMEHGRRGVRWPYIMRGGRRFSSKGALKRFFAEITRRCNGGSVREPETVTLSKQRVRELERVDQQLVARGLM